LFTFVRSVPCTDTLSGADDCYVVYYT
jgi:hypothetical protein